MHHHPLATIINTGFIRNGAGVSFSSMRILGHYAVVNLVGGSGHYQLHKQTPLPCGTGDLLIVFPEIPHAYGPPQGEKWSEIYIEFKGPVFDLWRRTGILSPKRPILHLPKRSRHSNMFRSLALASSGTPAVQLSRICALQNILASAVESSEQGEGASEIWPEWLVKAAAMMQDEPSRCLADVADCVGVGYESFRKRFFAITGDSPARFRSRIVADLACKLIYEERLSNKELAKRLGFCDEFHFSRRFRQLTGKTPSQFRRSLP